MVTEPAPAAEADQLRALVAALVAANPGPQVTLATAQRWAAAAAHDAYEAGYSAGFLEAVSEEKHVQMGIAVALRESAPPPGRWRLLCGPCRRGGPNRYRPKCPRCEWRTRETFGLPHPDDYCGQDGAA